MRFASTTSLACGIASSRIHGYLDLVPLRLADDINRTIAHRREDMQSTAGVNTLFKANSLVGMFRSDAMALLHLVDLVGDQLHGEIIDGWWSIT